MTWLSGPMLGPGPALEDEAVIAELMELRKLEDAAVGPVAALAVGPFTAWALVALLQLTWRHPELSAAQRDLLKAFCAPLEQIFDGLLADVLEQGWNPERDVDTVQLIDERL